MTEEVGLDQARFKEGENGIVIEPSKGLVWMKYDTYQLSNKWMSWVQVRDYAEELNKKKYAGYSNWRMPNTSEARSLYDKKHANKDHMGQQVPVDKIFTPGFSFLCWTSEVRNKIQAVRFGYRRGVTTFDDAYRTSRGASRLVRDILKEDGLL
jgi:hypothetical protein